MSTNALLILQNMMTTLAGINGTGSFKTTVRRVEYWSNPTVQVDPGFMPWIGLRPVSDTGPHFPDGRVQRDLMVKLHCIVTASTPALTVALAMNLGDDIFEALNADTHRGSSGGNSNAVATYVGDWLFEEYTPDNNFTAMMVDVRVRYHRTTRAS